MTSRSRRKAAPPPESSTPTAHRDPELTLSFASSPAEVEAVRALFREYARSLPVDLAYQGFDREVADLPGAYSAPAGVLLLARVDGEPAGCVGLRRAPDGQGEVKRLYVAPAYRGRGLGRTLIETLIEAARGRGYKWLSLDTLPTMEGAFRLYHRLGFEDIAAYYNTPIAGTRFLRLSLDDEGVESVR